MNIENEDTIQEVDEEEDTTASIYHRA